MTITLKKRPIKKGDHILSNLYIIGSLNMDIVSNVKKFPVPGETIHSHQLQYFSGGKGANQAVAAARSGASCYMVGAVGQDSFAQVLIDELAASKVNTRHVLRKEGTSGTAIITVEESGENYIVLSPGSNGKLTPQDIDEQVDWKDTFAILLQNEISWETNRHIIRRAKEEGVTVWLNPAPAISIPQELWQDIDTFIMNETETTVITGIEVVDKSSATLAAEHLIDQGVSRIIITLGKQGCIYADASGNKYAIPAYEVKVVDTTAAGDTFIGAYAAACMRGESIDEALRYATASSALTVTKSGAQASIPYLEDVMSFMKNA